METTKSLDGICAKTTAILQARSYERFYADPNTLFADIRMKTYYFHDSWVLSVEVVDGNAVTEQASFDIDKTLSNEGQAKLWSQLLEWFEGTALCDAKLAADQPIVQGCRKDAMPPLKVTDEVFYWFINNVGNVARQALEDGGMTTTHPYIIVEIAAYGKRAKINAFVDNKSIGSLDANETLKFLEDNPNTVIYPSLACTGVETTLIYDNQASDRQKIRASAANADITDYNPIKYHNWLKDLKLQLKKRFLWDSEGAYSYGGFETPPAGDYVPKITEWTAGVCITS